MPCAKGKPFATTHSRVASHTCNTPGMPQVRYPLVPPPSTFKHTVVCACWPHPQTQTTVAFSILPFSLSPPSSCLSICLSVNLLHCRCLNLWFYHQPPPPPSQPFSSHSRSRSRFGDLFILPPPFPPLLSPPPLFLAVRPSLARALSRPLYVSCFVLLSICLTVSTWHAHGGTAWSHFSCYLGF